MPAAPPKEYGIKMRKYQISDFKKTIITASSGLFLFISGVLLLKVNAPENMIAMGFFVGGLLSFVSLFVMGYERTGRSFEAHEQSIAQWLLWNRTFQKYIEKKYSVKVLNANPQSKKSPTFGKEFRIQIDDKIYKANLTGIQMDSCCFPELQFLSAPCPQYDNRYPDECEILLETTKGSSVQTVLREKKQRDKMLA